MDILSDLNEPQKRAVTHIDGPLLVLAGAGSGKTRVIIRRVANLISRGIAPQAILAVTFTNKAAGEMQQRIGRMGVPWGATVSTFHSLCARLLREFAAEANLSPNYTIYSRDDQVKLVKEAMVRLNLPTANLSPTKVHATVSRAKNDLKTPEVYIAEAGNFYTRNVAKIYRAYERMLAENNALDFDDLLGRMAFLLRDHPEIRRLLGQRYQYILVDEYQDTNHAQYILAHGLALDHENICVTGDPDQSIYTWRGADINNILEFEADYPDATVIHLEENYRSTTPILSTASNLIANNAMRKKKSLWTRRTGGAKVHVVCCDDERAEARLIAKKIEKMRKASRNYGDVAIFYRVNSLSRVLEEAMISAGITYRIARGVEFYNRREIKDVLAYLKLLVNPVDDVSCLRIINTPTRGIGAVTLKKLRSFADLRGISLLEACRAGEDASLSAGPAKKVAAFADLIDSLSADLSRPVRAVVEDVVTRLGLERTYRAGGEDGIAALANVDELISTAAEFDETDETDNSASPLVDYLYGVSLVSDLDHFNGNDAGAVTLMTLHAAKGLEFPVVFVVGCEDGLLPIRRNGDVSADISETMSVRELEEERRLMFVGMTRAKDELTLTYARYRMIRGRTTPQPASQFLGEIGREHVEFEDITTPEPRYSGRRKRRVARLDGFYADTEERAIIEAMEDTDSMPPEYEYLKVGSRVSHPKFGAGCVVAVSQRWPETRADIEFQQWGKKRIVLSKTTLEVL